MATEASWAVGRRAPDALQTSPETGAGVTGLLAETLTPSAEARSGVRPEGPRRGVQVTVAPAPIAGLARLVPVAATAGLVLVRLLSTLATPLVALEPRGRAHSPA